VKSLGVKFHYGKALGRDFTLEDLKNKGYKAVFLGIGLSEPKKAIGDIYKHKNVWNSKTFLPPVADASKNLKK